MSVSIRESSPHNRPTGTNFSQYFVPDCDPSYMNVPKTHPTESALLSLTAMSTCSSLTNVSYLLAIHCFKSSPFKASGLQRKTLAIHSLLPFRNGTLSTGPVVNNNLKATV